MHNMYRFCCQKKNFSLLSVTMFSTQQQLDLSQDRFDLWVVKMRNITIQFALQQHSKTSCKSLLPVSPNLKGLFIVNAWLGQGRGGVDRMLIRILC